MNTSDSLVKNRQRRYRVWLSYRTSDNDEGRKELRCEVVASEVTRAIQAVLARHQGIDVFVATIERVASLEEEIVAD